ncbi:MAG: hypothetical protein AABZ60_09555 [Planctomycetota bacterium]
MSTLQVLTGFGLLFFLAIYAQTEDTLSLSPQYIDGETLLQQFIPALSPSAQIKYLASENLLIVQDQPSQLARIRTIFDILNQPPAEIEVHLYLVETKTPLVPTPKTWEELEALLKTNVPLAQSEIYLNTTSGESLTIEATQPQGRNFFYTFLPKLQGKIIRLKSELKLEKIESQSLPTFHYQNTLNFQEGEIRILASIPKEFHHSTAWESHITVLVQCQRVPRFLPSAIPSKATTTANNASNQDPVPPTEEVMPEIKLEGIVYQENNPKNSFAFLKINNYTHQAKAGLKYNGFKVLKIENSQVFLEYKGKQITLTMGK